MYFNFLKWEHLASYHPLSKVYTAKKAEYSLLELKKHPKKVQVIIIYVYYDTTQQQRRILHAKISLAKHSPRDEVIWECSAQYLRELGFQCVNEPIDFYNNA